MVLRTPPPPFPISSSLSLSRNSSVNRQRRAVLWSFSLLPYLVVSHYLTCDGERNGERARLSSPIPMCADGDKTMADREAFSDGGCEGEGPGRAARWRRT